MAKRKEVTTPMPTDLLKPMRIVEAQCPHSTQLVAKHECSMCTMPSVKRVRAPAAAQAVKAHAWAGCNEPREPKRKRTRPTKTPPTKILTVDFDPNDEG